MKCLLIFWIASLQAPFVGGGLGAGPQDSMEILQKRYGPACECWGGTIPSYSSVRSLTLGYSADCGDKTAYLRSFGSIGHTGLNQEWVCIKKPKPKVIPLEPGPCPTGCIYTKAMHSSCYLEFQECVHNGQAYFTAIPYKNYAGTAGSAWSNVQVVGRSWKYARAPCHTAIGQPACWPKIAPIHISDDGPTDLVREDHVKKTFQAMREALVPRIHYHPLLLPKPKGIDIDPHTSEIIDATHYALNITNPTLANDCWLCLALGNPWPLAIPLLNDSPRPTPQIANCTFNIPFRIQPTGFNDHNYTCFYKHFQNNSFDIDIGQVTFASCSSVQNVTTALCANPGQVLACGNGLAYSMLPANWTGLCILASLLPDIEILPGTEPVPIPTIDLYIPRRKRAIEFIPLLVGLGITGALATGSAGMGVAIHTYSRLTQQLADDIQTVYKSIRDLQDQVDSLAEVVLQNRRGLDLLTADKGGICLTLQEKCCFYANKSGIVRDRIKKHQEELEKRRRELFDQPFWSAWNGVLPYLLPLLGPLLGLLVFVSLGPFLFNKLMAFIKTQINSLAAKPIQVHYHRLDLADRHMAEP